jgi:hypothetical protein
MINPIHARPGRGRGLRPQARHAVALLPGLLALGLLVVWPVVRANAQGFTFVTVSPKAVGVSSNLAQWRLLRPWWFGPRQFLPYQWLPRLHLRRLCLDAKPEPGGR